jgi:hypothetical protein
VIVDVAMDHRRHKSIYSDKVPTLPLSLSTLAERCPPLAIDATYWTGPEERFRCEPAQHSLTFFPPVRL